MLVIEASGVNDAYEEAVELMAEFGEWQDSRNGRVRVSTRPVTTVYYNPRERVLLNECRDANPFFHFFECLWMLSGSNEGAFLDRFVRDFSSRYAEPESGRIWGAYGHRWRRHFGIDQLDRAVELLRENPLDRRVVIAMWDPWIDLQSEYSTESRLPARDVPCNTHIYPRIVGGRLDITVMCRSNDVVWGAYGANAVHFSFLQEYLAGRIGVEVGRYYQISNNWHLYESVASKFRLVGERWYPGHVPIGNDWDWWDQDLSTFMRSPGAEREYRNSWFSEVARPMWSVHEEWSEGRRESVLEMVEAVAAPDWQTAAREWMERRLRK